jgi:hypothetical protein
VQVADAPPGGDTAALPPVLRHTVDRELAALRWSGGPVDDATVQAVRDSLGDSWRERHHLTVGAEIAGRLNAALGTVPQPHRGIASRYELRREVLAALVAAGSTVRTVDDGQLRAALTALGPGTWTLSAVELGQRVAALLISGR